MGNPCSIFLSLSPGSAHTESIPDRYLKNLQSWKSHKLSRPVMPDSSSAWGWSMIPIPHMGPCCQAFGTPYGSRNVIAGQAEAALIAMTLGAAAGNAANTMVSPCQPCSLSSISPLMGVLLEQS